MFSMINAMKNVSRELRKLWPWRSTVPVLTSEREEKRQGWIGVGLEKAFWRRWHLSRRGRC